jgi:hypothetical protein
MILIIVFTRESIVINIVFISKSRVHTIVLIRESIVLSVVFIGQ